MNIDTYDGPLFTFGGFHGLVLFCFFVSPLCTILTTSTLSSALLFPFGRHLEGRSVGFFFEDPVSPHGTQRLMKTSLTLF